MTIGINPQDGLQDATVKASGGNSGAPEVKEYIKTDRASGVAFVPAANQYTSLWQFDGIPGAGAAPTVAAIPTNATNGALGQTNASGGFTKYITGAFIKANGSQNFILFYDRLAHIGGLVGNVNTEQSFSLTIDRYTSYVGNEIWIEIYTAIGSATTVKAKYTNENNTAGQQTPLVAIGGAGLQEIYRVIRLPLAAGDLGVKSVESITLTASTGTAGNIGVTIAHPLFNMEPVITIGKSFLSDDGPEIPIESNACVTAIYRSVSASLVFIDAGGVAFIEG